MNATSSINVMPSTESPGRCWVLDDTRPGHLHQSLAIVRALGLKSCPEVVSLWEAFPHAQKLTGDTGAGLLIGCGRRAAACSKKIKRLQPLLWTNIQILDPRTSMDGFDWVIVPHHDRTRGPQVINYLGALTGFDEPFLENSRQQSPGFGELTNPRIVMLVGGPTRRAPWLRSDFKRWLAQLREHEKQQGGTAMLLNSRRTPGWANRLMARFTAGTSHFYRHDTEKNPYAAILGFADVLWVTADSVNMLSEACSTSNPVRALGRGRLRGRIQVCAQQLAEVGRLLDDWENPGAEKYEPLREASRLAAILRRRGALLGIE